MTTGSPSPISPSAACPLDEAGAARLRAIAQRGVSLWLDDLSRARLTSGNLAAYIDHGAICGVTTNPAIFSAALRAPGAGYFPATATDTREVTEEQINALIRADVQAAADVLADTYRASGGVDGRVSIEVDPRMAHDTEATIAQARELWAAIDRPNLMIKIPATIEGLPAIETAIAEGISVNATLIFSVDRYRAVMNAYLAGLERAQAAGLGISAIHSVASFFVSRLDVAVDGLLSEYKNTHDDAAADPGPTEEDIESLYGRAAIANAQLAFEAYLEVFSSPRFAALAERGGNRQRPLWASTGVKNEAYSPIMYVDSLIAPGTVNTVPEATLLAAARLSTAPPDQLTGKGDAARSFFARLDQLGIHLDEVTDRLEVEGVEKFIAAWNDLLSAVHAC